MSATPAPSLPQPDELSAREKDYAMAAYLMMFASWAIGLPFPLVNLVACLACAVLVNVLYVVLSIIALTRARRGRFSYLPLAGGLAFRSAYRPRSTGSREHENRPPEAL